MKKIKINKKYTHFAVRIDTGKIVDGWEYSKDLDKESIKEYYKIDMADNDRPLKEYKLLTAKYLLSKGTDPFNGDNWGN
jgi:hypothetical protein